MRLPLGLAVAAVAIIADQASKYAVLAHFGTDGCATPRLERVTAFFDLALTCNPGISFGLFSQDGGLNALAFSAVVAVIVAVLIYWLSRAATPLLAAAIGLIIGGAIGNVIDRLRLHAVVDFLYFHVGSWYWPAFNLADSAICLGVAAMLLEGLLFRRAES